MTKLTKYLVLLVILSAPGYLLADESDQKSLVIAPLSITLHPTTSDWTRERFSKRISDSSATLHPGIHLIYQSGANMTASWVFSDSFGNLGGGLMHGRSYELFWGFSVGGVGGLYIRKRPSNDVHSFPHSFGTDDIEAAVIGGATVGQDIPLPGTDHELSTNCLLTVIVNNCSLGVKVSW